MELLILLITYGLVSTKAKADNVTTVEEFYASSFGVVVFGIALLLFELLVKPKHLPVSWLSTILWGTVIGLFRSFISFLNRKPEFSK